MRDRIKVAKSPPPPGDLAAQIEKLRLLAEAGDRQEILAALRAIVPTYRWTPNHAVPPAKPERAPRAVLAWQAESAACPLIAAPE